MLPPRRRARPQFADRHADRHSDRHALLRLRRCPCAVALSLLALSISALLLLYSPAPLSSPRLPARNHSALASTSPLAARVAAGGAVSWARRAWRGQAGGAAEGEDGEGEASGGGQAGMARRRQLWARGRPFQGAGGRLWPGRVWRDEERRRIQAHGGGVLYVAGERRYYWYGENKEGETYAVKGSLERVDVVGISCYSSSDLLHWTPHGVVLAPNTRDPSSDLHVSRVMERPKVLFNAASRRYVMWLHVDDAAYDLASTGVAISDQPQGPFRYMGRFRPNGQESRDMTVFQDDDGTAYVVYASEMNAVLHIARLTPDYLDVDGGFVRRFVGRSREAPAVFKYQQHYFLLTSACTGWDPNEAEVHVASHMMADWRLLGTPCSHNHQQLQHQQQQQQEWAWHGQSMRARSGASRPPPSCRTTFESQGTFVLALPNAPPGVFVFLADRWNKHDLADSRYVWLPLHLVGNASGPTPRVWWGEHRDGVVGLQQGAVESGAVARAVITWHESWELPQAWLHKAETAATNSA
ncbi:hypothetical protein CLOM_g13198 [Closterium sp. NIES-68]|nr:hypothetical protein CLOM_g13198 [Closterium sp. NIES-68]GJP76142.1 hypothetical protein CLOP_g6516 [Closterium sp. NIES-67]